MTMVAADGLAALKTTEGNQLKEALRYGQALAAWNCGFEGARGGMYFVSPQEFRDQVEHLLKGSDADFPEAVTRSYDDGLVDCPACPKVESQLTAH